MKQLFRFYCVPFLVLFTSGMFAQNVPEYMYFKFNAPGNQQNYAVTAWYDLTEYLTPPLSPLAVFDESMLEGPVELDIVLGRDLPFYEPWDQGSFTFNGWTLHPLTNTNWSVNSSPGNPAPSAGFSWVPIQYDYGMSLETPVLNGGPITCAMIWCDFDYKLVDRNSTGEEKLFVDVFYDGGWTNKAEFSNTGSNDWTPMHVDITAVKGKAFKVRFRAEGLNSADILHWYVDNIYIYASSCESARIDVSTLTIWNGSFDNDWFNQANWNDDVPGVVKPNAWIPSGLANYPTISNPGAVCHDIYIRDGASILGNGFLSISGLAYVERLVNHLGLTNYWQHCNWLDDSLAITYPADIHYLSSPVPDAKDSTVEQDAVWRWQEPDQYWKWLHHSCSEPCKGPPWIWTPGIGYSVAPNEYWWCETDDCSDYNTPPGLCAAPWKCQFYREFIDNGLNYGSIDVPLTYTVQLPGMLYPPGWNLLGNPYPSAIDWFAVPTVNVFINSACMWDDVVGGYEYVVGQNGFIPIIQGFMVQCAPGGGSVTFIEAARLHNNNVPLWKSGNTSFLTLQVSNSVNSYKDATYIGFNSEAEDGFDLLDGTKLGNLSNAPMIYSVLPDNTSLAVNSLNSSQTAYQVPVHFKAGVAGNHTINVTGIESINDNTPLYLEDRKLDISQDIRGNPVYTFSANPSDDRDRFILHFAPLGIKDFSLSNVAIYSYDKNVCINVPAEVIGTASVINLLGMEILSQKLIPGKLNKISVTGLTGYYVVRVVSSGNVFTQKVFIN